MFTSVIILCLIYTLSLSLSRVCVCVYVAGAIETSLTHGPNEWIDRGELKRRADWW